MICSNKLLNFFLFLLFLLAGCKKGWLDINYDPQQLSDKDATPNTILPTILAQKAPSVSFDQTPLQYWMGYWCPPGPTSSGAWEQTYNIPPNMLIGGDVKGIPLIENMEAKALLTNQLFYAGAAKVIKAMLWSRAVDFYNNIPYREAFKTDILYPKYDDGKFIYEDCMKQLDLAMQLIQDAEMNKNIRISEADIMFHGDKSKWMKFINTVKLRLLIHQANRSDRSDYIRQEMAKIQSNGNGFLSTGEDASVNPGYTNVKPNPFYDQYSRTAPTPTATILPDGSFLFLWEITSANMTSVHFLKRNKDPRLYLFYAPVSTPLPPGSPEPFPTTSPADIRGNKFGLPVDGTQYPFQRSAFISQIRGVSAHIPVSATASGILKGYDMNKWILTSVESLFLQAEAIQRGWLQGNAEEAYKTALRESFRWLNAGGNSTDGPLSDAVFNVWYAEQVRDANPEVAWQAAPDKYRLLMLQKWIGLNSIEPIESYTDYRRNGAFPDLPLSLDPQRIAASLPIRMPYPVSEYVSNKENVEAQGNIDPFTSKIWWMP